jgi:transcriptional regulator with XRE-family HTH domain
MKKLITEIRESKGLNQREFADLMDISEAMLSRLESGERRPGRKTLKGLVAIAEPKQQQAILNALVDDKMGHNGNGRE